jgi:hypothetical protein
MRLALRCRIIRELLIEALCKHNAERQVVNGNNLIAARMNVPQQQAQLQQAAQPAQSQPPTQPHPSVAPTQNTPNSMQNTPKSTSSCATTSAHTVIYMVPRHQVEVDTKSIDMVNAGIQGCTIDDPRKPLDQAMQGQSISTSEQFQDSQWKPYATPPKPQRKLIKGSNTPNSKLD